MNLEDLNIGIVVTLKNLKTAESQVSDFAKKVEKASNSVSNPRTTKALDSWNHLTKKLNKNIGTFIGSLFTVRGIWFALRKSMTIYLSQNEELKNKLDGIYYGIGSMFAPLLNTLSNILVRIVGYADVFVKALGFAGLDMTNLNKGASKLKKTLLGIDEINNLTTSDSSSSSAMINPFENLKLNEKIKKAIDDIGDYIKKTVEGTITFKLFSKLWNGETMAKDDWISLLNIGLGLTALGLGIASLTGSGTALKIGLLGIATVTWSLKNLLGDTNKLTTEDWKKIFNAGMGLTFMGFVISAIGVASCSALGLGAGIALGLAGLATVVWSIKHIIGSGGSLPNLDYGSSTTYVQPGTVGTTTTTTMTSAQKADWELQKEVDKINSQRQGGKKLASFDIGTNYVPNDQLAYVHKGEAIIPKKFNSTEFFGETSAEELNLLASINEQLTELNNKNYTINLDGENVAKKVNDSLQQLKLRQGTRAFEVAR